MKSPALRASGLESPACRPLHSQHQLQTEKSRMHTLDDRNANVHSCVFVYIYSTEKSYMKVDQGCMYSNYAVITMWFQYQRVPKSHGFCSISNMSLTCQSESNMFQSKNSTEICSSRFPSKGLRVKQQTAIVQWKIKRRWETTCRASLVWTKQTDWMKAPWEDKHCNALFAHTL